MNKRTLTKIGGVFGGVAILMLFVIPFFIPDSWDNKYAATIYFILFLSFVAIGNITLDKSNKPYNTNELRLVKLKRILKKETWLRRKLKLKLN